MIRPALEGDVDWVTALEAEVFGAEAWSRAQVEEELLGERRSAFVIDKDAYIVTLLGDVLDLQRIAVAPHKRRSGLAHALLASVPTGRMLLEVSAANAGAVAFYEREGFTEISRRPRYYRDGTDAIVMERP